MSKVMPSGSAGVIGGAKKACSACTVPAPGVWSFSISSSTPASACASSWKSRLRAPRKSPIDIFRRGAPSRRAASTARCTAAKVSDPPAAQSGSALE